MKRAIVTIACGVEHEEMAHYSHPTFRAYAERLGCDFIPWNEFAGHTLPAFKKLDLGSLLDRYDRVLYLDNDILVRDDAPDIFALVPEDRLGIFEEGCYYADSSRAFGTLAIIGQLGGDTSGWDGRYYNTGVMVLSQAHRDLFVRPAVEIAHYMEQSLVNALISMRRTPIFPLPYQFNRMCVVDTVHGDERFASYFVHYAGFVSSTTPKHVLALMKSDLATWSQSRPEYRFAKRIAFVVEGDLSEQLAAEPVIRYARDVAYPGDTLAIVAPRPEMFAHLKLPVYGVLEQVPGHGKYRRAYTYDDPRQPWPRHLARDAVHPVDLAALTALGGELPLAARTPQLAVDPGAAAAIDQRLSQYNRRKLIVMHPGRNTGADTLGSETWKSFADALVDAGYVVAIAGERQYAPLVDFDRSRCVDLTDLSLAELIALLAVAPVLVAGHSPLVAIAGAFENHIGLIGLSRNPEFVLPYRHGSPFWKAEVLDRGCQPTVESALRFVATALRERSD